MAESKDNRALPTFECNRDQATVGARWTRWKRAFELYLTAKNITGGAKKLATLLYLGGMDLQEIHDSLNNDDNDYDGAITKLNEHFAAMKHVPHERHLFRKIKQESDEAIDHFVVKLRTHAKGCEFGAQVEDFIRDQVIDGCKMPELREKLLRKPYDLKKTLEIARAMECSQNHAAEYHSAGLGSTTSTSRESHSVNKIAPKGQNVKPKTYRQYDRKFSNWKTRDRTNTRRCYRCGYEGHIAKDPRCPAQGKSCNKCKMIGHFSSMCNSKKQEQRKVHHVEEEESEYAFSVYTGIRTKN
jgi:hypothetical protein